MRISLASDHAGFDQKQELLKFLEDAGHEVIDEGPTSDARVDYPDFAALVGHDVSGGRADFGVLVCGTGIGMCMGANKIAGIRASNPINPEFAALSREHNDANVVCLSARFVALEENERILEAFLSTEFSGGRHADRVAKLNKLDHQ